MAPLMTVGVGMFLAPAADAAVQAGRTLEVFHGRNIVGVEDYPLGVPVLVEVVRGDAVIGHATYTPQDPDPQNLDPRAPDSFFEINHLGDGDCWQSKYTPNILPGDVVRTTVQGEASQDFTVTRDVFINQEAEFVRVGTNYVIRVTGHARSTDGAPIEGTDTVELRMNKVNDANGWDNNADRRDLRHENPTLQQDGSYTHDFVVSADDWNDAQTAGIDISTVWIRGGEAATELTFYDGEPEATVDCPPLMPDDLTPPSIPTGVEAVPVGPDGTRVTWTPSTDNVAVTGYDVYVGTELVGQTTVTATRPGTTFNDGPLGNGVYEYTVVARDATPNHSPASQPASVTVGGPAAPTGVAAEPGDSSATVSWTEPTNTGGGPVTGYKVRVFDGATEVGTARNATVSPLTVTGLTNGTDYTVRVAAVNSIGTGVYSAPVAVTPAVPTTATAPDAPTAVRATAGNASATVQWTAPLNDGGSAITGYTVNAYQGTGTTPVSSTPAGATPTSVVVPGLVNGTAYTFDVVATNGVGTGPVSTRSTAVTPTAATVPGAPTIGTPIAGDASARVRWTAPRNTGGSAITGYEVRAFAGTTSNTVLSRTSAPAGATEVLVPNLTNGQAYTFRVAAINAVGTGTASARSTAVTPRAATTDTTAPTVGSRNPVPGSTGISRTANVTGKFSEAVLNVANADGSSNTVRLTNTATGTRINAVVSYNSSTWVFTLNPSVTLTANTRYTITLNPTGVTPRIQDAAGNVLATPTSWNFTTGAA